MNILACGALANELLALKRLNNWTTIKIRCLPAHYHQTPQRIPGAVKQAIAEIRSDNDEDILVAYGDCGTGGQLDAVLKEAGVERIPGAHCYEFFAGSDLFSQLCDAEIGTFYLTDFLVTHFNTYVWRALGLDRKPELRDMYFGNYKKLVYLAQTRSDSLVETAKKHADTLGLQFEYQYTAYGEMHSALSQTLKVSIPTLSNA